MLNFFRRFRERGWQTITADDYGKLWQQFGGSVITHPDVVARLGELAQIPVRYLGFAQQGALVCGLPCWGRYLALSKRPLKQRGLRDLFDLGNAEVILPLAPHATVPIRHKLDFISGLNQPMLSGLREQKDGLMLAREPEQYSKKFRYNQRRELRLFEQAGGTLRTVQQHSPAEMAAIYADLFSRRFGFAPKGVAHLAQVFGLLYEFMTGQVLYLNGQPIAVQILYRTEAPNWISLEYINGGVDPAHQALSPGSVLCFVNTQNAWEEARKLNKPLRYSFGRADKDYKTRWCERHAVYCT